MSFDFDELDEALESSAQAGGALGAGAAGPDGGATGASAAAVASMLPRPRKLKPAVEGLFGAVTRATVEDIQVPADRRIRVVTISDIHVDHPQNMKWFEQHLPQRDATTFDVLVLPGDVSDEMDRLRRTLEMFTASFDLVCFTPGNHDVWVARKGSPPDSMAKFREVMELCTACRVRTGPVRLRHGGPSSGTNAGGEEDMRDVLLVPLLSWYSDAWDREPDMPWWPKKPELMGSWSDYVTVKWPTQLVEEVKEREGKWGFGYAEGTPSTISEVFAAVNEQWLDDTIACRAQGSRRPVVISYSHFLPRQELFPPKRFLVNEHLHKVSGSIPLEAQVRRLGPDVHVFGHTHLTVDLVLEGLRYVQWALGTPGEQKAMTRAVGDTGMLVLYDSAGAEPHLAPVQETFWGRFFAGQPRDVHEICPAPFIRALFAQRLKEVHLPFDDLYFAKTPNPGPSIETYEGLFEPRWRQ